MRVVHRLAAAVGADVTGLLPDAATLEDARFLCKRFAAAGLREVSLVPFGDPAARTWLALESMQVTGSFKVRGAMLAIAKRKAAFEARPDHKPGDPFVVVAVSAGNHGVGVAHAAKHLGAQAEVVVPTSAPKRKIDKIASAGAKVILSSSSGYDGAEKEAIELARARGVELLSPYDDIDVLTGNGASLGFEIVRALGRVPGAVYCPIGGGGLATGLACAFRHELATAGAAAGQPAGQRRGLVIPVQSEASCAFAMSLERDSVVTELPPAEATLAEGLEGGISERAFARARAVIDRATVCEEKEIESALRVAVEELGLVLEGSAAVSLVPFLDAADSELAGASFNPAIQSDADAGEDTVIVLTGRNIDADRLARV
jgi:threonine dehydratase